MFKYFSFPELVITARDFAKFLTQCMDPNCKFIWVSQDTLKALAKKGEEVTEEQWEVLQKLIVDLNNWGPSCEELAEEKIFISHGSCTPCTRNALLKIVPQSQERNGYRACFGTAVDGHCSEDGTNGRPLCAYYKGCVVNRRELAIWQFLKFDITKTQ